MLFRSHMLSLASPCSPPAMSNWSAIANSAKALIAHGQASHPHIFSDLPLDLSLRIPLLDLSQPFNNIAGELAVVGCSPGACLLLADVFNAAVREIGEQAQDAFADTIRRIAPTYSGSGDALQQAQQALGANYMRGFQAAAATIRMDVLAEVEAHRTRMAMATTNERGVFSDEATTILHAVYERQTNVSRREKQALSERTGLSLAQIATWVRRSLCSRSPSLTHRSLTHRAVFQPPRSPRTAPPQGSLFRPPLPQRSSQRRRRRTPSILPSHLLPLLYHLD